jgi:hypothetical protein
LVNCSWRVLDIDRGHRVLYRMVQTPGRIVGV